MTVGACLNELEPRGPFYPDHLFREAVVAGFVLAAVMLAGRYLPVPVEKMANPTDAGYVPRPEWYFSSYSSF